MSTKSGKSGSAGGRPGEARNPHGGTTTTAKPETDKEPGTDEKGRVVTETGREVGTWPDNGQPQKAGNAGEESLETESNVEPVKEPDPDPNAINPQTAGDAGEKTPASASTTSDAGPKVYPQDAELAEVTKRIAADQKRRDELITERDTEIEKGRGPARNATTVYKEHIERQMENKRARVHGARAFAQHLAEAPKVKAPVDADRERASRPAGTGNRQAGTATK